MKRRKPSKIKERNAWQEDVQRHPQEFRQAGQFT